MFDPLDLEPFAPELSEPPELPEPLVELFIPPLLALAVLPPLDDPSDWALRIAFLAAFLAAFFFAVALSAAALPASP